MNIGINTLVDLDMPFDELLRAIASAGFDNVSLSHRVGHAGYHLPEGRATLAGLLRETGLVLNYIHVPIEDYHDLSSTDPQVRKLTIETYKMCLQACHDLGGRSIVAHATGRRDFASDDELAQAFEASLESTARLCDYANELGVAFCLENLPIDHDWQKLSLRVMAAADFDGFGLCLDTCHAMIANDDPLELVNWMAPRVRATHLSDTMGAHDSHLLPGEGEVDFKAVGRELGRAGFDGVVDLECSLLMLRGRRERQSQHPGDTIPCSTEHYLEKAAAAARRIADYITAESGE